jgi:hypothetical protein
MERLTKEYLDLTGEEKGKYDYVRGMLFNLAEEIKKEVAYPSCSDLLIDTEHLLAYMDAYIRRYYESYL